MNYSDLAARQMMETWDEEFKYGFAEADDSDYDAIRKMINFLRQKGIKIP